MPAFVAVKDGRIRVGLTDEEVEEFADPRSDVAKVARRDYPAAIAAGGLGATTVSATLWAAHRAGIEIMATGGIGGVHPGSGDVSADLLEMARVPGFVVCSGPKSIVDPAATLEKLEELGILVAGYGVDKLPFFLSREADLELEHRIDSASDAARGWPGPGVRSAWRAPSCSATPSRTNTRWTRRSWPRPSPRARPKPNAGASAART